jgi:hypothetical protein
MPKPVYGPSGRLGSEAGRLSLGRTRLCSCRVRISETRRKPPNVVGHDSCGLSPTSIWQFGLASRPFASSPSPHDWTAWDWRIRISLRDLASESDDLPVPGDVRETSF